jgi:hypothetical protein
MIATAIPDRTVLPDPHAGLVDDIRRVALERAGYAIPELRVERDARRIIVRGTARTFYAWQLVQKACRDLIAGRDDIELDCAMTVTHELFVLE